MNLKLRAIFNAGDQNRERLTLRAATDLDIGDYVVAQTGLSPEGDPTIQFYHTIWLPYKEVKKGDLVVVYTKDGDQRELTLKNKKNKAHFVYMGLSSSIWDNSDTGAIVLHAPQWDFLPQKKLTRKSP